MRTCPPASSWLAVVPRAVDGFWVKRWPTAPAKWTSPPKARVTAFPLPFQSGLRGEWAGNERCNWWTVVGAGGFFLPPPERKTK